MTGHLLGDLVLLAVAAIVLSWLTSALIGWIYLAWLFLPVRSVRRRISALLRRDR